MAANQQTLDDIFLRLAAGEVEAGHAALLQACGNESKRVDLDTLILAAIEFTRYPRNRIEVEMLVKILQRIGGDYPRSAAESQLVFLTDVRQWTSLTDLHQIRKDIGSQPREGPQGPHEEALLLLFEITVASAQVLTLSARTNSTITNFPLTPLIQGCTGLQLRESMRALNIFADGAANPEETVRQFRQSLGDKYGPDHLPDGGVSIFRNACQIGAGLA